MICYLFYDFSHPSLFLRLEFSSLSELETEIVLSISDVPFFDSVVSLELECFRFSFIGFLFSALSLVEILTVLAFLMSLSCSSFGSFT